MMNPITNHNQVTVRSKNLHIIRSRSHSIVHSTRNNAYKGSKDRSDFSLLWSNLQYVIQVYTSIKLDWEKSLNLHRTWVQTLTHQSSNTYTTLWYQYKTGYSTDEAQFEQNNKAEFTSSFPRGCFWNRLKFKIYNQDQRHPKSKLGHTIRNPIHYRSTKSNAHIITKR